MGGSEDQTRALRGAAAEGRRWRQVAALLACAASIAGCAPEGPPEYREGRRISLIGRFDRAVVESAPLEPPQLALVGIGGEERAALLPPAPTSLRYPDLRVPPDATLRFGFGLDERHLLRLSDGARFVIRLSDPSGATEEAWSGSSDPLRREGDRRWQDVEVDLGRWAGQTVDLILSVEPGGNPYGDWAAWSNPVIRSPGEAVELSTAPIRRRLVERDLLDAAETPDADANGSCVQRVSLEVPPAAALDLGAQVLRDEAGPEGVLGPVRFAVRVDDATLWSRELTTGESILTVTETIPLDDYAGREVELSFEVCDVGQHNSLVWARRLWLTRSEATPRQPASAGPNVLMLMVDTLRADRLGTYGYGRPTSPELDRLAGESLVFEQAISQSSWTLPAVASLLTGQPPIEHGVIEGVPLPPRDATLAELLQAGGVTTYGFSSNPIVGRLEAMHRGFESFAQVPFVRADQVNGLFTDWLEEHRGLRWFAYLHYMDPHSPYDAPAPDGERFTAGCQTPFADGGALQALSEAVNLGVREAEFDDDDIACLSARYDGEVRYWDAELRGLLAGLKRLGVLDDTIVIVTADHGEEFMEHGQLLHGYQLYEESIHVPLVLWGPGRIPAERRPEPVETRSVFTTVLELMGVAGGDRGPLSLLDAGRDPAATTFSHTTEAFIKGHGYTALAAVRDARWKYILRPEDGDAELFDLQGDPGEKTDLEERTPEMRDRYRGLLDEWLSGARHDTIQIRGMDLDTLEKLRALGYIR